MKQRTLTNIILLALLVFNVGFLGSWWYGHWKMHHLMRERYHHFRANESRGARFLAKKLGLTGKQEQQLDTLREEHFKKIRNLEFAVYRNEINIMNAIAANPSDSAKAMGYADSVGILKAAIQKELFNHFNKIKEMCSPGQAAKFDSLVMEMSKEFPHYCGKYQH